MKRLATASVCAFLLVLVMPTALAKGPGGLIIEGPGISGELTIMGDGTSASAEQVNAWIGGTGFPELAYGANTTAITPTPQTENLGPEYRLTWIHMGPEGDFEVPALMYPLAEGGALVYMEPGGYFEDIDMTVPGGWYHSSADLAGLLGEYGVEVAPVTEKAPAQPPVAKPAADELATSAAAAGEVVSEAPAENSNLWLVMAGLGVAASVVGLWATGRRPRRLKTS